MDRYEKEKALLNKFTKAQLKSYEGYRKRVRGYVDQKLNEEYDLIIKGIAPKAPKIKKEKKEDKKEVKKEW